MNAWWRAGLGLLIAAALVVLAGYLWLRSALPAEHAVAQVAVDAKVQVLFDHRGRPFVTASTWEDAFFAQGWLHARDRLWQMEMFRRAGRGRLAQALGARGLATDEQIWRAGVPELAARLAANASDGLNRYVSRYVAGVNAQLQHHGRAPELALLGIRVEPWQREDVFALGALMAFQSANNLQQELLRAALVAALGEADAQIFFPRTAAPDPLRQAPAISVSELLRALAQSDLALAEHNPLFTAPRLGSNAWAVAPARTRGGHALLAFDSHDSVSLPNLTYDVHLFVGREQIRGASVPGLLGVINGYNEFMAWGFTNIGDSQDVYLETRDAHDPMRFLGRSGWYQAERKTARIPVRDAPDHRLSLVQTQNGRLISDTPALSVRWSPLDAPDASLDALLQLNRATSFAQFETAMDAFVAPSANVTYADTTGCIAQRTIGRLPRRGAGRGLIPLPGHESDTGWLGLVPTQALPKSDTAPGYVAAANRPLQSQPLVSADNAPGYRVRRLHQYFAAHPTVDLVAMHQLQTDVVNLQAHRLLPRMLAVLAPDELSVLEAQAYAQLKTWSEAPEDHADSAAALIFAQWYQSLVQALFAPRLAPELLDRLLRNAYLINEALDNQLLADAPGDWPIDAALRSSFEHAISQLQQEFGADVAQWQWGRAHTLTLRHELSGAFLGASWLFDREPRAAGGGNATLGRARYRHDRPFAVSGGATSRMVLRLSQPIEALMVGPGGQSGLPFSAHYNDQTDAWLAGSIDRIAATPEALRERGVHGSILLRPP